MKTSLAVPLNTLGICLMLTSRAVNSDERHCNELIDVPTKCYDECTAEKPCSEPAICCPGSCYEEISGSVDNNKRAFNVCSYPDPCVHGVCKNGATCVLSDNLRYKCECVEGYTGDQCEIDINECNPKPCKNGSVCKDLIGNYTCCCPPGFSGRNCTQENGCQSETPCHGNCPRYKDKKVICRLRPRYFIKDKKNGKSVDVTEHCSMP